MMVLLLNLNVMLSTFEDLSNASVWDSWGKAESTSQDITVALGFGVILSYGLIIGFMVLSYAPLQFKRAQAAMKEIKSDGKVQPFNYSVVVGWLGAIGFYAIAAFIHASRDFLSAAAFLAASSAFLACRLRTYAGKLFPSAPRAGADAGRSAAAAAFAAAFSFFAAIFAAAFSFFAAAAFFAASILLHNAFAVASILMRSFRAPLYPVVGYSWGHY